jgi:hypothetical protein
VLNAGRKQQQDKHLNVSETQGRENKVLPFALRPTKTIIK